MMCTREATAARLLSHNADIQTETSASAIFKFNTNNWVDQKLVYRSGLHVCRRTKLETLHTSVQTHFARARGWQETTRGGTTNCA